MSGKFSIKTVIILIILVLVGVLGVLGMNTVKTYLGSAAAGSEPKGVLATPSDDGKSAVVTWTSDKTSQATVEYGTTPASLLLRSVESDLVTDHKVTITPLKSGVNYYFRIRIGEDVFDNNGIPFSFKTKEAEETTIEVVPTVAAAIPTVTSTVPTCQQTVDYNNDGIVNSLDYMQCIKNGGGSTTTTNPVVPTITTGGTGLPTCVGGVDYDANGTINSLDMVKCLQKK
jgi:hypothetical protein